VTLPRAHPLSSHSQLQRRWLEEVDRFEYFSESDDVVASAQLAAELEHFEVLADADDRFVDSWVEWNEYVWEQQIWLPLEQSCWETVLLSVDQRMMRLQSCPESLLRPYRWFLELCPAHVKHYLAMEVYLRVRVDRSLRTGSPEWYPAAALADPEPPAFFRPLVLSVRRYS
jgi:hypothetical protein